MKEIKLTKNKTTFIDDEDYEWLSEWKWNYGSGGYAVRNSRKDECEKRKTILMHRIIIGTKKGEETDHINGNRLDNRRSNIRPCMRIQNRHNTNINKNNTSGFKGVVWYEPTKKWRATICINWKIKSLGYFKNKKEAAIAYNNAAKVYYGNFAKLNLI